MNSPYLTQNPDEADYFYVWVSHRVKQAAGAHGYVTQLLPPSLNVCSMTVRHELAGCFAFYFFL